MRALLPVLACLCVLFAACKKEPGVGGQAEIRGYVLRQNVNGLGAPIGDAYPYPETRVYIVYGDHDFYDNDVRTGPDGLYVFHWLRTGNYKVFTYGECLGADCPSGQVQLLSSVTIKDKSEVVTVPTMIAKNFP